MSYIPQIIAWRHDMRESSIYFKQHTKSKCTKWKQTINNHLGRNCSHYHDSCVIPVPLFFFFFPEALRLNLPITLYTTHIDISHRSWIQKCLYQQKDIHSTFSLKYPVLLLCDLHRGHVIWADVFVKWPVDVLPGDQNDPRDEQGTSWSQQCN